MVNIGDLARFEREILTLAAEKETTILSFDTIQKNFNLKKLEDDYMADMALRDRVCP